MCIHTQKYVSVCICVCIHLYTHRECVFYKYLSKYLYLYIYSYTHTLTYTNLCFPLSYYGQSCAEKIFCKYFNEINLNSLILKLKEFKTKMRTYLLSEKQHCFDNVRDLTFSHQNKEILTFTVHISNTVFDRLCLRTVCEVF